MLLSIDFKNVFISISLNISDIELEEDSDIDESENFNIDIQIYLIFEGKYEEFIVIRVNLSIIKRDNKEYLYNEDDFYLEFNNAGYNGIIQINCIYNYYALYLKPKAINIFFFKIIFKLIKKIYREEKTKYWILTIRTTIYRTFILSFEYPSIYIKERAILKRC